MTNTNRILLTDEDLLALFKSVPQMDVATPGGWVRPQRIAIARAIERRVIEKLGSMPAVDAVRFVAGASTMPDPCDICQGTQRINGGKDECPDCGGTGMLTVAPFGLLPAASAAEPTIQDSRMVAAGEAGAVPGVPFSVEWKASLDSFCIMSGDSLIAFTYAKPDADRICGLLNAAPPFAPPAESAQPAEPEWIDNPHDIEQGMMRNPKYVAQPAAETADHCTTCGLPVSPNCGCPRGRASATADAQVIAIGLDGLVCEHCGDGHTELTFEEGEFACNCDTCSADCQYFAVERLNALVKPKDAQGKMTKKEIFDHVSRMGRAGNVDAQPSGNPGELDGQGDERAKVPANIITAIQAYGDARADGSMASASKIYEAIHAILDWGSALSRQPAAAASVEAKAIRERALQDAEATIRQSFDKGTTTYSHGYNQGIRRAVELVEGMAHRRAGRAALAAAKPEAIEYIEGVNVERLRRACRALGMRTEESLEAFVSPDVHADHINRLTTAVIRYVLTPAAAKPEGGA